MVNSKNVFRFRSTTNPSQSAKNIRFPHFEGTSFVSVCLLPCFSKLLMNKILYGEAIQWKYTLFQTHHIILYLSINLFPALRHDECFSFDSKRPPISPDQAIISDASWVRDKSTIVCRCKWFSGCLIFLLLFLIRLRMLNFGTYLRSPFLPSFIGASGVEGSFSSSIWEGKCYVPDPRIGIGGTHFRELTRSLSPLAFRTIPSETPWHTH
jgi:hypothetical protein